MAKPTWTLDQIVDNLNRNGEFWNGSTITYSFLDTRPVEYDGGNASFLAQNFNAFNAAQRAAATKAIELWDDVIAPSLIRTDSGDLGDIRFANAAGLVGAGAFLPGNADGYGGDVWFDNTDPDLNDARKSGDFGFYAFVHEIGHALGLEHPGDYNAGDGNGDITYGADAEYRQDSLQYTAMSYFGAFETGADHYDTTRYYQYAASPLLHDIAAVQAIYGADQTTRTEDTVYGFNSTADREIFDFGNNPAPVFAIWDAGGIDTLDYSGFTAGTIIDLREGEFSSTPSMIHSIVIAYGAKIENAIGTQANDYIQGNYLDNVIEGNSGDDLIDGNGGNDTLIGGAGRDVISGESGNDHLIGGDGNDFLRDKGGSNKLWGDRGNDTISGGRHTDTIYGGDGNDTIEAGSGNDTIYGDAGDDVISGGVHDDTLYGGEGNDTLNGETGEDTLHGGKGDDRFEIAASTGANVILYDGIWADYEITRDYTGGTTVVDLNVADGDEGTDYIEGDAFLKFTDQQIFTAALPTPPIPNLILNGNSSNDFLHGDAGDDTISGGDNFDYLYGEAGDDTLIGGEGSDRLFGGDGIDTAGFEGKRSDYWITFDGDVAVVAYQGRNTAEYGGTDRVIDVEKFSFADGVYSIANLPENIAPPLYIKAKARGGNMFGGAGDDTLIGRGGNDKIFALEGDDIVIAGSGNNKVFGYAGNDVIVSKGGRDKLFGMEGDDTLVSGSGNDKLFGGLDNDTLLGGSGNDQLFGMEGDDFMYGGKNNNKLFGGAGNDTMYGGKHVDKIYGQDGDDTINGGAGRDKLYGMDGDDTIEGGKHDDKLYGMDGNDWLSGGSGKDTLLGGEGDDTYVIDTKDIIGEGVDQGIDTVESYFSYGLRANFENLVLTGGGNINGSGNTLNNYLWGNEGNNRLSGGDGEDTLDGYLGNDLLIGGDDADTFLFTFGVHEGEDIILDFDRTQDVLAFDDVIDGAGNDLADIADQLTVYNEGEGGDVVLTLDGGTEVRLSGLGVGAAENPLTLNDLVDDTSTQVVTAPSVGLVGFITTEGNTDQLEDDFVIT